MSKCQNCLHELDAHTAVEVGTHPSPGDISICFHCAAICTFGEGGDLVPMTEDQFKELREDEEGYRIVTKASDIIRKRIKQN